MAALSDNTRYTTHEPGRINPEVFNAEVLYAGAYVSIGNQNHATSEAPGRVEAWSSAAGRTPSGWSQTKKTGDTSASPIVRGNIDTGARIALAAVTGLTGDETDVMKLVYASTDADFTLTRPSAPTMPIGFVADWKSSTQAYVEFFSQRELLILSLAGNQRRLLCLGSIVAEAGATNADLLKGYVATYHGFVTDYFLVCVSAPADADVAGPVTLEIDGTDLNFATSNPTIDFSDTLGLKISGSGALTATAFHEGSLFDIEADFTAAGTVGDGIYNVYVDTICLPGL